MDASGLTATQAVDLVVADAETESQEAEQQTPGPASEPNGFLPLLMLIVVAALLAAGYTRREALGRSYRAVRERLRGKDR